jgi:DNA-binding transcriptional ArsR family regulator
VTANNRGIPLALPEENRKTSILIAREPLIAVELVLSFQALRTSVPAALRAWYTRALPRLRTALVSQAMTEIGRIVSRGPLGAAVSTVGVMTGGLLRDRTCCRAGDAWPGRDTPHPLHIYYRAILEPYAGQLGAALELERAGLTELLRAEGAPALLRHPAGTERPGPRREPAARPVHSDVVVVPSAFCLEPLAVNDHGHGHTVLVVPMGSAAQAVALAPPAVAQPSSPKPLEDLLGRTRAAILRHLREPLTTTRVARRSAISTPTASRHLSILREAGLVQSRRQGNEMHHQLTPLGQWLTGPSLHWAAPIQAIRPAAAPQRA